MNEIYLKEKFCEYENMLSYGKPNIEEFINPLADEES